MGVIVVNSTLPGGVTPICNECGAKEDWDLEIAEYNAARERWDNYVCPECSEKARRWGRSIPRWKA